MKLDGTLGFLGFGNMGGAIARGLCETGAMSAEQILVRDVDPQKQEAARSMGAAVAESGEELASRSHILVLAVKPQQMAEALDELAPFLSAKTLVVSIAAGISLAFLQRSLGSMTRCARVMPNTPALVQCGACGVALSANCTPEDERTVRALFEAVGICEVVPESAMDAVTALSGSGPAYFFLLVESMVAAAVQQGLEPEQAKRLAAQTCLGAGQLLAQSGEDASVLRERVTSKGGTTAAALAVMTDADVSGIVDRAMAAAAQRSVELGQ